jgi:hypothetical protein
MTLPIDRTAKSALDTNLINGNTSDAPKLKANNDVVYNTIDELNAAVNAQSVTLNQRIDGLLANGDLTSMDAYIKDSQIKFYMGVF